MFAVRGPFLLLSVSTRGALLLLEANNSLAGCGAAEVCGINFSSGTVS